MQHKIQEDMEVIGADGVHVGTVDHIEGNRIKLKRPIIPACTATIIIISNSVLLPTSKATR